MGDRAWVGITFYDVPSQHLRTVFDFLDEMYGMRPGAPGDEGLILGEQYSVDEMSLGWCSDEVSTLVANNPGIVVEAWQGNRYEFNGEVLMHTPELGTFLNDVDGGNEVILSDSIVEDVYKGLPQDASAEQFKLALEKASGTPWLTHFRLLEDLAKNVGPSERTLARPDEEDEDLGVEVKVVRSAGEDGAVVVFIDTDFEPDASDAGPGLRVFVNDGDVYTGVPHAPKEDAGLTEDLRLIRKFNDDEEK